jgi:hypothetical protein
MKILHNILKVLLALILLMPILGVLGIFPPPTRDLYNTDKAFDFINMLTTHAGYINYIIVLVFAVCIVLLFTRREALAAVLILPIMVNIVGFHMFLDGGLFTAGAIPAIALLLLDVYFLWKNRKQYKPLLTP